MSCQYMYNDAVLEGLPSYLISMLANPQVHCVRDTSCFYSPAVSAVCIVGRWAEWTDQKQKAPHTQLTLF